jgi:hypothetical protein
MNRLARPTRGEYAPYYEPYIAAVPDGKIVDLLRAQLTDSLFTPSDRLVDRQDYSYQPNKWTVKEVLGHCIDAERVFAYRALWFARGDRTVLPGFDENLWVPESKATARTMDSVLDELRAVRASTVAFFDNLSPDVGHRTGTANGATLSVQAAAYIIYGHLDHHVRVLRDRYLG